MVTLLFIDGTAVGKFIQAFSWMLLHSLWQGLIFFVLTAMVLLLTKKTPATLRYNLIATLGCLFLTVCTTTFWIELHKGTMTADNSLSATKNFLFSFLEVSSVQQALRSFTNYVSTFAPYIVLGWGFVFSFKALRMLVALRYNERARQFKTFIPEASWEEKLNLLAQGLRVKQSVMLRESGSIPMPIVIGHFKPMILMPLGILSNMPAEQVEAILLHELAHIRRHDYLANVFQHFGEAIFFFNPGFLWMSALLRNERENCCDDIAILQTKNKHQFIQALIAFKEIALLQMRCAPAFPGRKNTLLQRVTRLVRNKNHGLNLFEKITFISAVLLAIIFYTMAATPPAIGSFSIRSNFKSVVTSNRIATKEIVKKEVSIRHIPFIIAYVEKRIRQEIQAESNDELRQQAEKDELLAREDEQRALEDRAQAYTDKLHADQDREQADSDKQQADSDKQQADRDRQQADRDKQLSEMDRIQQLKDQHHP